MLTTQPPGFGSDKALITGSSSDIGGADWRQECMNCAAITPISVASPVREQRLSTNAAFYLLASITVSFLAASAAPTPLYPLYQAEWGFSAITVTLVFGVYAIAVLGALLVVGKLSDHLGRRPVLAAAIALQAVTMLIFASADSVSGLMTARIVQGLSTGAAVAAVGAGLLDLDKVRGALANSVAPMAGTASGGIGAGLMVQYLPAPTELIYLALGGVLLLQGVGIAMMSESTTPRPGALASLRPQFRLPHAVRVPFLLVIPALVATWAMAGFYASLGPAVVRAMFDSQSLLLGGAALFVLAGSGVASVLFSRNQNARTMLMIGASSLFIGAGITVAAITLREPMVFFVGTILAGIGFGNAFQGAVRSVVPLVAPTERAGLQSEVFVVSYLAMGVPAVVAGYLIVQGGALFDIARGFGVVVMALSALVPLGVRWASRTA
jgi:predicted MFS family arabinose efflux permease